MSLEVRVEKLEEHHKQMDANLHSLAKVCAEIKNICMANQHDMAGLKTDVAGLKNDMTLVKSDVAGLKTDMSGVKACIAALADATHAGFKRADEQHNEFVKKTRERFDQLELLIRQSLPNN